MIETVLFLILDRVRIFLNIVFPNKNATEPVSTQHALQRLHMFGTLCCIFHWGIEFVAIKIVRPNKNLFK